MLHVTNIKFLRILPNTPCVLYFWKADAKYSSVVMQKRQMSHVLHVTFHKFYLPQMSKTPCVTYIWKVDANTSSMAMQKTSCHMWYMSYATNVTWHKYKVAKNAKSCSMAMQKSHLSHVRHVTILQISVNECRGLHWVNVLVFTLDSPWLQGIAVWYNCFIT